jgi:hypothetical protein
MIRGRYNFGTLSGNFIPSKDDSYDLGSSTKEFRNLYIDGIANIDSLIADTADINGGTIDGVTIGVSSACTQLTVDNLRLDGNTISNINSGQNIILLPTGTGITVIGDAGSTSHSLNTNDDAFVAGKLEVDGTAYFDGNCGAYGNFIINGEGNSLRLLATGANGNGYSSYTFAHELVTIPIGSGLDPVVVSSKYLAPATAIIRMVAVRVTQAPGGGATTVSVGRTNGGNTNEFINAISTALGTTGNMAANNDGVLAAEDLWNNAADTFTISTDADVTGTAMKIRIMVWYEQFIVPTS